MARRDRPSKLDCLKPARLVFFSVARSIRLSAVNVITRGIGWSDQSWVGLALAHS
jgi:hypothetical protein